METTPQPQDPDDPRAALAVAADASRRLTDHLTLASGPLVALGAAVAVQVATAAVGIAAQTTAGLALVLSGFAVFLAVAGGVLHRFRRTHGVRVDGLVSQVLLGPGASASVVYLAAVAGAIWAAFGGRWWLVALAAAAAGTGCALGVRAWWRAYRRDPAGHARGATPRVLVGLAVAACVGFAALLVVGR